jgi:long-chain acyl-CoA synthetase
LKNGSSVVPLNVLLKAPEVEYHLSDSQASALVTWSGFVTESGKGAANPFPVVYERGHSGPGLRRAAR